MSYNRPFTTRADTRRPRTASSTPSTRWSAGSKPTATTSATSPASTPTARGARCSEPQGVPVGRPRRVLVGRAARQRRGGPRRRRQPGVLQRQRGVLEDALGDRASTASATPYRTLVMLQGDARQREDRSRRPRVDRHLARPALQPARRRRPAGERADRHDLHGQLPHATTRSRSRPRTAACASGATPASPTLRPGRRATLPAGTLGYEWDEDVDNGFRPAGLDHGSSTTTLDRRQYLQDYGSDYAPAPPPTR